MVHLIAVVLGFFAILALLSIWANSEPPSPEPPRETGPILPTSFGGWLFLAFLLACAIGNLWEKLQ